MHKSLSPDKSIKFVTGLIRKPLVSRLLRKLEFKVNPELNNGGIKIKLIKTNCCLSPTGIPICVGVRGDDLGSVFSRNYCKSQMLHILTNILSEGEGGEERVNCVWEKVGDGEGGEGDFITVLLESGGDGVVDDVRDVVEVVKKKKKNVVVTIREILERNSGQSHFYNIIKCRQKIHNRLIEETRLKLNSDASSLEEMYALESKEDEYKYTLNISVKNGEHDVFNELDKLKRYTIDRLSSRVLSTFRFILNGPEKFRRDIDEGMGVEVLGGGPGFEIRGVREYERVREMVGVSGIKVRRICRSVY